MVWPALHVKHGKRFAFEAFDEFLDVFSPFYRPLIGAQNDVTRCKTRIKSMTSRRNRGDQGTRSGRKSNNGFKFGRDIVHRESHAVLFFLLRSVTGLLGWTLFGLKIGSLTDS